MPAERSPIREAWADGTRPEPPLLVSEWADQHRHLPQKSSAEPGPWRTSRTPYLREIMDNLSAQSPVEDVVLMAAAQLGKSEAILNALGYLVDHSPGPAMIVQPTVELAKRFSRQRIDPLFGDTPRLKDKVAGEGHSRDAANSMLAKDFMGGTLIITGANSAVGLRSMPARWLLLDEIDGYPADVDEEGAPIDLAEARQRTFTRRKRIKCSTPTIAGSSAIEAAYDASDQRRYHVPCPRCGVLQPLVFERLTWTKLGLPPSKAVYQCAACDGIIENHEKTEMLARGEWVAARPDADPKIRGYHLSALYSPVGWLSWGQIAEGFVKARKNPEKLRVWTNTVLGEAWAERGEAPDWQRLFDRRASYQLGSIPSGGLFLTAGADVQKDRIVYEVIAWGRGKRSWSIDYGVLPGNTDDLNSPAWSGLKAVLDRGFDHEHGHTLSVRMLAVDSGWNTQTVYTWCRGFPMSRVIAIKGQEGGGVLISSPSPVDINMRGRKPITGYKVWPVHGAVAKSELYGWLRLEAEAVAEIGAALAGPLEVGPPPGWCEFPEYDEEYFRQLTAEHLVTRKNKAGFTRVAWELIPGRENHVLDARVYARAASMLVGLDRFKDSDFAAMERSLEPRAIETEEPGGHTPPPAPAAPPRRPGSGWLGRRRGGWLR